MRYFADQTLALDVIKKSLSAEDPYFKIDGGEVSRDGQLLAEIEINKPGSDMFSDDINGMMQKLQQINAAHVMQRIRGTQRCLLGPGTRRGHAARASGGIPGRSLTQVAPPSGEPCAPSQRRRAFPATHL